MCEGVNRVHDLKSMVTEYWEVTVNRKSVREYAKRQRVGRRLSRYGFSGVDQVDLSETLGYKWAMDDRDDGPGGGEREGDDGDNALTHGDAA